MNALTRLQVIFFAVSIALAATVSEKGLGSPGLANQADVIKLIGTLGSKAYYIGTGLKLTWRESWEFCISHRMHLASIESSLEQKYIVKFLEQEDKSDYGWWLSGTDAGNEGEFIWFSTGKPFGYTNWAPSQPDNAAGVENHVHIWPKHGYKWNDLPQTYTLNFICEANLEPGAQYLLLKLTGHEEITQTYGVPGGQCSVEEDVTTGVSSGIIGVGGTKPEDCCALQLLTGISKSGIYTIYPFEDNKDTALKAFCDFETNGGGWTVVQRREELRGPIEKFYRNWRSYEVGFGSLDYSHWLGLSKISALTRGLDQMIRFELLDWEGDSRYAEYNRFSIGDQQSLYFLTVADYTGTAGDSLSDLNGRSFTTHDQDNDKYANNCAKEFKGGWWYNACHLSNLNGLYVVNGTHSTFADGVNWKTFRDYHHSLKRVEMKIRNRNFPNGCVPVQTSSVSPLLAS